MPVAVMHRLMPPEEKILWLGYYEYRKHRKEQQANGEKLKQQLLK
jgi:hypothetical protein